MLLHHLRRSFLRNNIPGFPKPVLRISTQRFITTMSDIAAPDAKRVKVDTNEVPKIGTHNGHFHADEALAVFLLRLLPRFTSSSLLRSRDPSLLATCSIIVDVGGLYTPPTHYDHHQREFSETFSPSHSTKLSSAGLVYKHYARELLSLRSGLPETHPSVELLYGKLYEEFIEALDANDNGISAYPAEVEAKFSTGGITLPSAVAGFNPSWNEEVDQAGEDARFLEASKFIGGVFERKMDFYVKSWLPARDFVVKAIEERGKWDEQGRVLVFERSVPWKDHLFTLEKEEEGKGKALYVLYGEGNGSGKWRIQCVPESKDSFISRKPLPEAWRGQRDDDLSKVSGIPGGIFVHASGFIGGNASFEGALEMAKKALEM